MIFIVTEWVRSRPAAVVARRRALQRSFLCNRDVLSLSQNIKSRNEPRARRLAAMRFRACPRRIDAYIDAAFGRVCLGRYASWLQ